MNKDELKELGKAAGLGVLDGLKIVANIVCIGVCVGAAAGIGRSFYGAYFDLTNKVLGR